MNRLRGGEREAFMLLVRRHQGSLYNFALRQLASGTAAEEVVQEAFARVAQNTADFGRSTDFASWLYTITRDLCVDAIHKRATRRHPSHDDPQPQADASAVESSATDAPFGELDELTRASLERHVAGCTRCAAELGDFQAPQRVASAPHVAPPLDFEQRVIGAALSTLPVAPPRRHRWASVLSMAGGWAMRPQTAMAALFLVTLGTSVLLMRGRSSRAPAIAPVTVVEEGSPAPAEMAMAPAASGAPDVVGATAGGFDAAMAAYRAKRFDDAKRGFDSLAAVDVNAELWAARALRESQGCAVAAARFDQVNQRAQGTTPGWEAQLDAGRCYVILGNLAAARARLRPMLAITAFRERAQGELDRLGKSATITTATPAP